MLCSLTLTPPAYAVADSAFLPLWWQPREKEVLLTAKCSWWNSMLVLYTRCFLRLKRRDYSKNIGTFSHLFSDIIVGKKMMCKHSVRSFLFDSFLLYSQVSLLCLGAVRDLKMFCPIYCLGRLPNVLQFCLSETGSMLPAAWRASSLSQNSRDRVLSNKPQGRLCGTVEHPVLQQQLTELKTTTTRWGFIQILTWVSWWMNEIQLLVLSFLPSTATLTFLTFQFLFTHS